MVYHVFYRLAPNQTKKSSNRHDPRQNIELISISQSMPRYHYSRAIPDVNTSSTTEAIINGKNATDSTVKVQTAAVSTNDENNFGGFRAAVIPLVNNGRLSTEKKRDFVSIPITREDGTSIVTTNNQARSVPITYINETTTLLPISTHETGNSMPKPNSIRKKSN